MNDLGRIETAEAFRRRGKGATPDLRQNAPQCLEHFSLAMGVQVEFTVEAHSTTHLVCAYEECVLERCQYAELPCR